MCIFIPPTWRAAPDGNWKVMASRADAPGGLGYALENRLVVSQTFPESFADMRVARLAAFFNAYKESVTGLGASRRDRAVLLTPGPWNEAYFEHVYLAHYLGLPARYVSGYLLTRPPPGRPRLLGADASHAWFSVWTPPFGWVDLDPTNNVLAGEAHVTSAWGRDYGDVAPVAGIILGGHDHVVEVGVDVIPVVAPQPAAR